MALLAGILLILFNNLIINSADTLHRHGAQGKLSQPSKGMLENEFGTSQEDEVVKQILEKGTVQESMVC